MVLDPYEIRDKCVLVRGQEGTLQWSLVVLSITVGATPVLVGPPKGKVLYYDCKMCVSFCLYVTQIKLVNLFKMGLYNFASTLNNKENLNTFRMGKVPY